MKKLTEKTKRIFEELSKYPKGIWIRELARLSSTPEGSISYYIFGQIKRTKTGEKRYGGYLEEDIDVLAKEGKNKKIKLKPHFFRKRS